MATKAVSEISSETIKNGIASGGAKSKLSVMDIIQPPVYFKYCFFYENSTSSVDFMLANSLKKSLLETLKSFPDVCGSLEWGDDGLYHCDDNRGVIFSIGKANFSLSDARDVDFSLAMLPSALMPSEAVFHMATKDDFILLVRVTYLTCSSVAIGVMFCHQYFDAHGMVHFMRTWASVSRNGNTGGLCSDTKRSLLAGSEQVPTGKPFEYTVHEGPLKLPQLKMTSKAFLLTNSQLEDAKKRLKDQGIDESLVISKNDVVSAVFWQAIMRARKLNGSEETTLAMVMDARKKIGLPEEYIGNCVFYMCKHLSAGLLNTLSLKDVAAVIRDGYHYITKEKMINTMNWISQKVHEGKARALGLSLNVWRDVLLVSSHARFEVYDTDFGCGRPVQVTVPVGGFSCIVILPSADRNGLCVHVCLSEEEMDLVCADPGVVDLVG